MTRSAPNFAGRAMRPQFVDGSGEVGSETLFSFFQEDDMVWAFYSGGDIRFGCLVGTTRNDGILEFRYVQLNHAGDVASGRSRDEIEVLPDGRLRLHESWTWESKAGEGTSILEEVG